MPAFLPPTFAMTLPAFDERRAGGAEESLVDVELAHRVDVPQRLPGREIDRVQLPFGAVRVDDAVGDDRHGARPFVESEIVAVGGGIRVPPLRRAGERVERLDDLAIVDAMKQNQPRAGDDRAAEPLADLLAPQHPRTGRRPLLVERRRRRRRRCATARETAASRRRRAWSRSRARGSVQHWRLVDWQIGRFNLPRISQSANLQCASEERLFVPGLCGFHFPFSGLQIADARERVVEDARVRADGA